MLMATMRKTSTSTADFPGLVQHVPFLRGSFRWAFSILLAFWGSGILH